MTKQIHKKQSLTNFFQTNFAPRTLAILNFILVFIDGALVTMIGYTSGGIASHIFPDLSQRSLMTYLVLAQGAGMVTSMLLTGKLIRWINIRWILSFGMLLAIIMLLLISQIDQYTSPGTVEAIVLFSIFSFILGFGIAPVSTLVAILITAIYSGKKQTTVLLVVNCSYGLGAGIIPLTCTRAIFELTNKPGQTLFDEIRFFYYIAIGFAFIAMVTGLLLNYKHQTDTTKRPKIERGSKVWMPIIFSMLLMAMYMIVFTTTSYSFNPAVTRYDPRNNEWRILCTEALGAVVFAQGVWRLISGLFIVPYLKLKYCIILSFLILIIALSLIVAGLCSDPVFLFVIAVLLGMGLGNLWPMIMNYGIQIEQKKSAYIGMIVGITSVSMTPITQLIVAIAWTNVSTTDTSINMLMPFIICIGASIVAICLTLLNSMVRKKHQINS